MKKAGIFLGAVLFFTGTVFASGEPLSKIAAELESRYRNVHPSVWGEHSDGIVERLPSAGKVLALTFDACGSEGDGYDRELIEFLRSEKVPATLFINSRWIDKNPAVFKELSQDPLFEIENHGAQHRPASVTGKSVYGLQGTNSVSELVDEVESNARKIEALTGRKPRFFRSGTAYYDDVAVQVIHDLGYTIAGFSVLGDRGATYSAGEVRQALLSSVPGSIVILHMNHPEKQTAEGVREALPELRRKGFRFVRLDESLPETRKV